MIFGALLHDKSIRKFKLEQKAMNKLAGVFEKGKHALLFSSTNERLKPYAYDGCWHPDANEILVIRDYSDDNGLMDVASSPSSFQYFDQACHLDDIKALFLINENNECIIQNFNASNILRPQGRAIIRNILSLGSIPAYSFEELSSFEGIMYGEKIHAVIIDRNLFFTSFTYAHQSLDLKNYLKEATDEQLAEFCDNPLFAIADVDKFIKTAKTNTRKDVSLILDGPALKFSIEELIQSAANAGIELPLNAEKTKIVIPEQARERAVVFKFLKNGLFRSIVDHEIYESNSHRRYIRPVSISK